MCVWCEELQLPGSSAKPPKANPVWSEGGAAIKDSQWRQTSVHTVPRAPVTHLHVVQSPPAGCNLCRLPTWGASSAIRKQDVTGINLEAIC